MKNRILIFRLNPVVLLSMRCCRLCGRIRQRPKAGNRLPAKPIYIALIYPMTGDNAMFGEIEVRAHKYVIDQINAAGGINGRQIAYEVFDDRGDPKEAANIAQKVVGDPKFVAGIGHFRSVCTLAAAPIYDEAEFIFLTNSVNSKITGISPWLFRYSITDSEAGKQLGLGALQEPPRMEKSSHPVHPIRLRRRLKRCDRSRACEPGR